MIRTSIVVASVLLAAFVLATDPEPVTITRTVTETIYVPTPAPPAEIRYVPSPPEIRCVEVPVYVESPAAQLDGLIEELRPTPQEIMTGPVRPSASDRARVEALVGNVFTKEAISAAPDPEYRLAQRACLLDRLRVDLATYGGDHAKWRHNDPTSQALYYFLIHGNDQ